MIVIKAPNHDIPLHGNQFNLLEALRWLIPNNPFYSKIEFDFHDTKMYPDDNIDSNLNNPDNEEDDDIRETVVPMKDLAKTVVSLISAAVLENGNPPSVLQWP